MAGQRERKLASSQDIRKMIAVVARKMIAVVDAAEHKRPACRKTDNMRIEMMWAQHMQLLIQG